MIKEAIESLRAGKPILIHDSISRENETDIVIPSQFISPDNINFMRKNGGGLICTTMTWRDAEKIGLTYLENIYSEAFPQRLHLFNQDDLRYDRSSAFTLSVNSRDTFTGISDYDRYLTISNFSKFISEIESMNGNAVKEFDSRFRSPGHVFLLIARNDYFNSRQGHTELSTYMMELAGLVPSATIVEMLSDTGKSASVDEAMKFAEDHQLTFIEGESIIREWVNDAGNGHRGIRHPASGAYSFS
ncbi:MAG: 3,4-dihydroxy-2-butanone-4-phosphate synthase [Thermoplasmata archaeon]